MGQNNIQLVGKIENILHLQDTINIPYELNGIQPGSMKV